MKRFILCLLALLLLCPIAKAVSFGEMQTYLDAMLQSANEVYLPDSVKNQMLGMGMRYIAGLSPYAAEVKFAAYVTPTGNYTSIALPSTKWWEGWNRVNAIKLRNEDFSLYEIQHRDIGQRGIVATGVGKPRYWYHGTDAARNENLGVYPPYTSDTTHLTMFVSVIPAMQTYGDTLLFNNIYEIEVVLYAFALSRLREGDLTVGNFIMSIVNQEIMDLTTMLENRPKDIMIQPKVLSR